MDCYVFVNNCSLYYYIMSLFFDIQMVYMHDIKSISPKFIKCLRIILFIVFNKNKIF